MGKLRKTILWVMALSLLNVSCAIFHPDRTKKDELGYYISHFSACGPIALEKAFEALENPINRIQISRDIQDTGNGTRLLLSMLHHGALQITLPSEIKTVCKKYGYKVIAADKLNELDPKKDVALVLVWGEILDAHWLCFPIDVNIDNFFGGYTKISKIFIFKKI